MFPSTRFTRLVGIRFPIIQAPMAGGATTPELVAAVSNAGGLGSFAAALLSPDEIRQALADIRARTRKPFNVNLLVLDPPQPDPRQVAKALELLRPIREELGLPPGTVPAKFCEDFSAQFEALVEAKPAVASFTFALLKEAQVTRLKKSGTLVIGTATTVAEARAWEAVGADLICAQGAEAGGHRGTFLGDFDSSTIGTLALVPQVVDAVRAPVIAAGGIMDGRGIAASMMLGASGAQLGTAFLTCPEAAIPPIWKSQLRTARDDQTQITRAFSGRPARALVNEYMRRFDPVQDEFPPYPVQNALTTEIRRAAAKANRPEFLSLLAGQGAPMSRGLPAADLMAALVEETKRALGRTRRPTRPRRARQAG